MLSDPDNHECIFNLVSLEDEACVTRGGVKELIRQMLSPTRSTTTVWEDVLRTRRGGGARQAVSCNIIKILPVMTKAVVEPQSKWWWKEGLDLHDKVTKFFNYMSVEENGDTHPGFDQLKSEARNWFYIQVLCKRNEET